METDLLVALVGGAFGVAAVWVLFEVVCLAADIVAAARDRRRASAPERRRP